MGNELLFIRFNPTPAKEGRFIVEVIFLLGLPLIYVFYAFCIAFTCSDGASR